MGTEAALRCRDVLVTESRKKGNAAVKPRAFAAPWPARSRRIRLRAGGLDWVVMVSSRWSAQLAVVRFAGDRVLAERQHPTAGVWRRVWGWCLTTTERGA